MKRIIVDVDDTLSRAKNGDYANATVIEPVRRRLVALREEGFTIVLHSARNMRTYKGSLGEIYAKTLPVLMDWLAKNSVPYDEIIMGKPWCGFEGFYIDDKAVRPDEFASLSLDEIETLLEASKARMKALQHALDQDEE